MKRTILPLLALVSLTACGPVGISHDVLMTRASKFSFVDDKNPSVPEALHSVWDLTSVSPFTQKPKSGWWAFCYIDKEYEKPLENVREVYYTHLDFQDDGTINVGGIDDGKKPEFSSETWGSGVVKLQGSDFGLLIRIALCKSFDTCYESLKFDVIDSGRVYQNKYPSGGEITNGVIQGAWIRE